MVFGGIPRRREHVGGRREADPVRLTLEEEALLARAPRRPAGAPRPRVDLADLAGKVWASPNSALGLGLGALGYGLGQLNRLRPGDQPDPRIQLGHNAVEFIHNPLVVSPLTLGNTTNYQSDPYDPNDDYAAGAAGRTSTRR